MESPNLKISCITCNNHTHSIEQINENQESFLAEISIALIPKSEYCL